MCMTAMVVLSRKATLRTRPHSIMKKWSIFSLKIISNYAASSFGKTALLQLCAYIFSSLGVLRLSGPELLFISIHGDPVKGPSLSEETRRFPNSFDCSSLRFCPPPQGSLTAPRYFPPPHIYLKFPIVLGKKQLSCNAICLQMFTPISKQRYHFFYRYKHIFGISLLRIIH